MKTTPPSGVTWQAIEHRWPATLGGQPVPFGALRERLHSLLVSRAVTPKAFSHFGLVVPSIDDALATMARLADGTLPPFHRDWVESFHVHVARAPIQGVEIEFIQPVGPSFFRDALKAHAEGLQHASFVVQGIEDALDRLAAAGVELVDTRPRAGSHGKVAFSKPSETAPFYLELCEPRPDAGH